MIPITQGDLVALAQATAIKYGLDPALVCGICEQECGDRKPDPSTGREQWNTWAFRNEPGYDSKYIKPLHKAATEEVARSCSWGVTQLMGESARELGYTGYIPELFDPSVGLDWGCRWFKHKLELAGGNTHRALELWNGGGDPTYADQVLARVEKYRPQPSPETVGA